MKKKIEIREAGFSDLEKEALKEYFFLRSQADSMIWIDASGYSMLPLFWPGCRARMVLCFNHFKIGQVVVFPSGKKLIAHRIVGFDPVHKEILTKGDTLCASDHPVPECDIVGIIDCIDVYGKLLRKVEVDPTLAMFSFKLGQILESRHLELLPSFCKKIVYFLLFVPGYLAIQIKRKVKTSFLLNS